MQGSLTCYILQCTAVLSFLMIIVCRICTFLIGVLKHVFVPFSAEEVCSVYGYDPTNFRIRLFCLIPFASISGSVMKSTAIENRIYLMISLGM
jgi:hypothetical protein